MDANTLKILLDEHQPFHSEYQMDHFIVGAGGVTDWGRYKQALRELDKRVRGLKTLYIDRELCQIDIESYEAATQAPGREPDGRSSRRSMLNATKKRYELDGLDRIIADTERELGHFYRLAVGYRHRLALMNGPKLGPEVRRRLEAEEWTARGQLSVAGAIEGATVLLPDAGMDARKLLQGGG